MTGFLDPTHVHPWYWYVQQMWQEFVNERMQWLIAAGLLVLFVQTVRRRWFEGAVVLMWAALPMAIISAGTSKLYHYAYPFLPPVALAAGYLVALVVMLVPVPLRKVLEQAEDWLAGLWPSLTSRTRRPAFRSVASGLTVLAATIAVIAMSVGSFRIDVGAFAFKSSGIIRPVLLILLLAVATRTSARVGGLVVALLVFSAMPLAAYRGQLQRLPEGRHPMRTAAECVQRVQAESGVEAGILLDMPGGIWHPLYYYFRRVQPVTLASTPLDPSIERYLDDPASPRPVLIDDKVWREYAAQRHDATGNAALSPPMVSFLNSVLLLPGPYAACSSEAALRSSP
jgi:hypothetical protein